MLIPCEWCMLQRVLYIKHLKETVVWNRLLTLFAVCYVILRFNHVTLVNSELEVANYSEMLRDRSKISTNRL